MYIILYIIFIGINLLLFNIGAYKQFILKYVFDNVVELDNYDKEYYNKVQILMLFISIIQILNIVSGIFVSILYINNYNK